MAENTPNDPEFICPIYKKIMDFTEKRLHWPSVVRGILGLCNIWLAKILSTNANLCGMLEQWSQSCI